MTSYFVPQTGQSGKRDRGPIQRVTKRNRCPVCNHDSYCYFLSNGTGVVCMRVPSSTRPKSGKAGYIHFFASPTAPAPSGDGLAPKLAPAPKPKLEIPSEEWQRRSAEDAAKFAGAPKCRAMLAADLGVPEWAFGLLPGVGARMDDVRGRCWTFPERDADGQIIGIGLRLVSREVKPRKVTDAGGKRGLTIPAGWQHRDGPLYLAEGPTDTLAMSAAALACIGRPSNTGGVALLTEFVAAQVPPERVIGWLGENDKRKPDGTCPGIEDSRRAAQQLADAIGRPVHFVLPPVGTKDVREWLAHSDRGDTDWGDRGRELATLLAARTEVLNPSRVAPASPPIRPPAGWGMTPLESTCPIIKTEVSENARTIVKKESNLKPETGNSRRAPGEPVCAQTVAAVAAGKIDENGCSEATYGNTSDSFASQSVLASMYGRNLHTSEDTLRCKAVAPEVGKTPRKRSPRRPPPALGFRVILGILESDSSDADCLRAVKRAMERVRGKGAGWTGKLRLRCRGWCCAACHAINRLAYAEFAPGIADGSIGVNERGEPLPVRVWTGTKAEWKALDKHLVRVADEVEVPRPRWVAIQRRYCRDDLTVLIFGSPVSERLPNPRVDRETAADVFARAIFEIELLDQRAMRGKRFQPVTESKPPVLPHKPKPDNWRVIRERGGRCIPAVATNAVIARAAKKASAYSVSVTDESEPVGRAALLAAGGLFGDRACVADVIAGVSDPESKDFTTAEPREYQAPFRVPVDPATTAPLPPPLPIGADDFDALFATGGSSEMEDLVLPVFAVRPPRGVGIVPLDCEPELVGPYLASAGKWVVTNVESVPDDLTDALLRLAHFVAGCERVFVGIMGKSDAAEIESDIHALRCGATFDAEAERKPDAPPEPPDARVPALIDQLREYLPDPRWTPFVEAEVRASDSPGAVEPGNRLIRAIERIRRTDAPFRVPPVPAPAPGPAAPTDATGEPREWWRPAPDDAPPPAPADGTPAPVPVPAPVPDALPDVSPSVAEASPIRTDACEPAPAPTPLHPDVIAIFAAVQKEKAARVQPPPDPEPAPPPPDPEYVKLLAEARSLATKPMHHRWIESQARWNEPEYLRLVVHGLRELASLEDNACPAPPDAVSEPVADSCPPAPDLLPGGERPPTIEGVLSAGPTSGPRASEVLADVPPPEPPAEHEIEAEFLAWWRDAPAGEPPPLAPTPAGRGRDEEVRPKPAGDPATPQPGQLDADHLALEPVAELADLPSPECADLLAYLDAFADDPRWAAFVAAEVAAARNPATPDREGRLLRALDHVVQASEPPLLSGLREVEALRPHSRGTE